MFGDKATIFVGLKVWLSPISTDCHMIQNTHTHTQQKGGRSHQMPSYLIIYWNKSCAIHDPIYRQQNKSDLVARNARSWMPDRVKAPDSFFLHKTEATSQNSSYQNLFCPLTWELFHLNLEVFFQNGFHNHSTMGESESCSQILFSSYTGQDKCIGIINLWAEIH